MTNNIMLDLETMSTAPSAAIIAIGAVRFDPETGVSDSFYRLVGLQSSVDAGLVIDPDTVIWWLKQSDEARQKLTEENVTHLNRALLDFSSWANEVKQPVIMWGNGSDFDNVILASAYKASHLSAPWKFYNNRCYRTIKSLSSVEMIRTGVHHCAVDDARSQAEHLLAIWAEQ